MKANQHPETDAGFESGHSNVLESNFKHFLFYNAFHIADGF